MMFNLVGSKRAILAIMLVAAVLSWGGVSAFVIVFAVYPLASEFFRMSNIPKRLIPCVIWLGGITFTMDTLPGSPQIHNIIPTYFFGTDAYAAPVLGFIGSLFIGGVGFLYIEWMRRKALANNEGYDSGQPLYMEPEPYTQEKLPKFWIAIIPLIVVAIANFYFTNNLVNIFGAEYHINFPGMKSPLALDITKGVSLWAVVIAMFLGIITVFILAFKPVASRFAEGTKSAVSGSLLAIMNTGSEFGYGSIIAVLPGFLLFSELLKGISQPPGK